MHDIDRLLEASQSVLLIDWPSRDVPETLARYGYDVVAQEGPRPTDYYRYAFEGQEVSRQPAGGPPERADLIYAHRPVDELPDIVDLALALGARAVWLEAGSEQARSVVEGAGLVYVDGPHIADAVRRRDGAGGG